MAKKRYSKRMSKIEPSVKTLTFSVTVPGQVGGVAGVLDSFIDLSQCASLVNRRFYRQGINWAVSSFKFISSPSLFGTGLNGAINIEKLPETWVMSNSWEKSFRVWQRMNNEALAESESIRPRFLDFKIYADEAHHAAGFAANLLPINVNGAAVPGEWAASKVVHPLGSGATEGATIESELIATGASYPGVGASGLNAVSLIEGYAASRAAPNVLDPNVPADSRDTTGATPENWMQAIFNEGTDQDFEVLTDMINDNNIAPYPFVNDGVNPDTMYPNGANQLSGLQLHDSELVTGTTIGGTSRLKGGLFPCGLINLRMVNRSESDLIHTFFIDLVPGAHRGYLCEPMTEM